MTPPVLVPRGFPGLYSAGMGNDLPDKAFYKIGEVCQYTDTQPYVLRFWESEFPQLAPEKNRNGQRVYRREDIDLIFRIKKLLYEEEYTIAGARRRLEQGDGPDEADHAEGQAERRIERRIAAAQAAREAAEPAPPDAARKRPRSESASKSGADPETSSASDAARPAEELLDGLRRDLEDTRAALRRSEAARVAAEADRDDSRRRMARAASRLEEALRRLDEAGATEGP